MDEKMKRVKETVMEQLEKTGLNWKIIAYVLAASSVTGGGTFALNTLGNTNYETRIASLEEQVHKIQLANARLDGENLKKKVDEIYNIVIELKAKAK